MNELIKINFESERPTISGRELHEALEVRTAYKDWFPRMCEYGFVESVDFNPLKFEQVQIEGKREVKREIIDHQITIPMAKELCMLQRNEKGKQFRQYFISVEEKWNSPEMIMKRALEIANSRIEKLETTNAVQQQQIAELQPKASYYDVVLNSKGLIAVGVVAKDYGWSASKLNKYLHEKGIQFKRGDIWMLYQKYAEMGYTSTKTHTCNGSNGEQRSKVHTYWTQKGRLFIYDLLKQENILPLIEREEQQECFI